MAIVFPPGARALAAGVRQLAAVRHLCLVSGDHECRFIVPLKDLKGMQPLKDSKGTQPRRLLRDRSH